MPYVVVVVQLQPTPIALKVVLVAIKAGRDQDQIGLEIGERRQQVICNTFSEILRLRPVLQRQRHNVGRAGRARRQILHAQSMIRVEPLVLQVDRSKPDLRRRMRAASETYTVGMRHVGIPATNKKEA